MGRSIKTFFVLAFVISNLLIAVLSDGNHTINSTEHESTTTISETKMTTDDKHSTNGTSEHESTTELLKTTTDGNRTTDLGDNSTSKVTETAKEVSNTTSFEHKSTSKLLETTTNGSKSTGTDEHKSTTKTSEETSEGKHTRSTETKSTNKRSETTMKGNGTTSPQHQSTAKTLGTMTESRKVRSTNSNSTEHKSTTKVVETETTTEDLEGGFHCWKQDHKVTYIYEYNKTKCHPDIHMCFRFNCKFNKGKDHDARRGCGDRCAELTANCTQFGGEPKCDTCADKEYCNGNNGASQIMVIGLVLLFCIASSLSAHL